MTIQQCRAKYDSDKTANGTFDESVEVGLSGRGMVVRQQGSKLIFIDLLENDAKV